MGMKGTDRHENGGDGMVLIPGGTRGWCLMQQGTPESDTVRLADQQRPIEELHSAFKRHREMQGTDGGGTVKDAVPW
jgi:hypothetical protein